MENSIEGVNVAPASTSGHFIQGANKVVDMDVEKGTFFVEGESTLVTKNHTSLKINGDVLVTTQQVYDPFAKRFEMSRD